MPHKPHEEELRQARERLLTRQTFEPGDIVTWKPGLRNRALPAEGSEGIVMEQLDQPILAGDPDSGSPYYREPLDLAVGVTDEDNDLVIYWYDSRRMQLRERDSTP